MTNPYKIAGPALISFSGGRTSGYMLHEILKAHDWRLPDDVRVCFANTGKEREETLQFVHECETRWGVGINWIEWRAGRPGFEQVSFDRASRKGEPFEALIRLKQRLPNSHERWCTQFLKVLPMFAFMRTDQNLEPGQYVETIGLRDDEGERIFKGLARADSDGRHVAYPLAKMKVRKADVRAFWNAAPFDLGLEPWEGNCDLCFLKGKKIKKRIIRDSPSAPIWWAAMETEQDGWFDKRDLVAEMMAAVDASPELFDYDDEYDVECGLHCDAA